MTLLVPLSFFLLLFPCLEAYALPQGYQVVEGEVSFEGPSPGELSIHASDRAIINFDSFSIAPNETVRFLQSSPSSSVLSRVIGASPSEIFGSLFSLGELLLVNPNGIHFGPQARVETGSFIASTLDIENSSYLGSQYLFRKNSPQEGRILNEGTILSREGGYLALLSETIRNEGALTAYLGSVALASGQKIALSLDEGGLLNVLIEEGLSNRILDENKVPIDNRGIVSSQGGSITLSAKTLSDTLNTLINQEGQIEAQRVLEQDGRIFLVASGQVDIKGPINTPELHITHVIPFETSPSGIAFKEYGLSNYSPVFREGFESLELTLSFKEPFLPKPFLHVETTQTLKTLENTYLLNDRLLLNTLYEPKIKTLDSVKQTLTFENLSSQAWNLSLAMKAGIPSESYTWNGEERLASNNQTFRAYEKTASVVEFASDLGLGQVDGLDAFSQVYHTYTQGHFLALNTPEGDEALFDWFDLSNMNHEVRVSEEGNSPEMELTLPDLVIPQTGTLVLDPIYTLNTATAYNIRVDGAAASNSLTEYGSLAIGDVNGDGLNDLVLGALQAANNGVDSGSAWVMFSTLIDDVGATTGNNRPLSTAANYNIRYDGDAADNRLTEFGAITTGDVNGDGLGDLVLGANGTNNNGASSGSAWVMFSTLIDDVGATTGNNRPLSTAANYNIRYDGGAASDFLTETGALAIGDVNGDGLGDLVLGARLADNNGLTSGSAWVMFSTLIDDVGASTGNNRPLSTAANYNIRYDGGAAGDELTVGGALAIGDVNGNGLGDLMLGARFAGNNGASSGSAWVMFSTLIDDVGVTTGNNRPLSTAANYNTRYDGGAASDFLTDGGAIAVGDVNGDGLRDLVLGSLAANNNGAGSGSVWVMFSTLIDDVGVTTGNNRPLSTAANYNTRYDGGAAGDSLTSDGAIAVGDVNGDGLGDLVLGAYLADNNGASSGSAWVMFSTLIDDVGATTGNNRPLSTAANYNIRYDGGAASDLLTDDGVIAVGDVNGDGLRDLVLGSLAANNNGAGSGSVWVMFSTLIDDVGVTTGNNRPLSTAANYTNRYDGAVAFDQLTAEGSFLIGDVNGDGTGDLVLGTRYAENNGASSGSAWVIFGVAAPPASSSSPLPLFQFQTEIQNAQEGFLEEEEGPGPSGEGLESFLEETFQQGQGPGGGEEGGAGGEDLASPYEEPPADQKGLTTVYVKESKVDVNGFLLYQEESAWVGKDRRVHPKLRTLHVGTARGLQVFREGSHELLKDLWLKDPPENLWALKQKDGVLLLSKSKRLAFLSTLSFNLSPLLGGLGEGSQNLLVSKDESLGFIPSALSDTIQVLDLKEGKLLRVLPAGSEPSRLALSEDEIHLYVSNRLDRTVSKINLKTGLEEKKTSLPGDPLDILLSKDGRTLFVTGTREGKLFVLDAASLEVQKEFVLGGVPWKMRLHPKEPHKLLILNRGLNLLSVFDLSIGKETLNIPLGQRPSDFFLLPEGDKLYVTNELSDNLSLVSLSEGKVTDTIPTGPLPTQVTVQTPQKPRRALH